MIRLLLFLVIGALAVLGLRSLLRGPGPRADAAPRPAAPEDMVRCARCGLNLPRSEALRDGEGWACSQAHLRARDGR
jgi:uncharacterized protein